MIHIVRFIKTLTQLFFWMPDEHLFSNWELTMFVKSVSAPSVRLICPLLLWDKILKILNHMNRLLVCNVHITRAKYIYLVLFLTNWAIYLKQSCRLRGGIPDVEMHSVQAWLSYFGLWGTNFHKNLFLGVKIEQQ